MESIMKINYQKMLDDELCKIEKSGVRPTLLLHACCAPCSSYVLEYLKKYFDITVYFYNPNIYPKEEYDFRADEMSRFAGLITESSDIKVICENYNPSEFYEAIKGYENEGELSDRCKLCYGLRLDKTAKLASKKGYDYFTTTLSISPHKNAEWLNKIGEKCAEKYNLKYLFSDFKKKNGYKRSCELSKEYGMYRQEYCGCVYSFAEFKERQNNVEK